MCAMCIEVVRPDFISIPLLGHIPHSAVFIPAGVKDKFLLTEEELCSELICMTDAYTDELFSGFSGVGGVTIVNKLSRLVFDPERFSDDNLEIMATQGMGVIYTKTSFGKPLRKNLTQSDKSTLLNQYYHPYHKRLDKEVASILEAFSRCLIIDGHSFPSKPLPYELDQNLSRPDICIGTDSYHTPHTLVEFTVAFFKNARMTVEIDRPFSGCLVPIQHYHKNNKVLSMMIEVNRRLYMNETSGERTPNFQSIKALLDQYICELAKTLTEDQALQSKRLGLNYYSPRVF